MITSLGGDGVDRCVGCVALHLTREEGVGRCAGCLALRSPHQGERVSVTVLAV